MAQDEVLKMNSNFEIIYKKPKDSASFEPQSQNLLAPNCNTCGGEKMHKLGCP